MSDLDRLFYWRGIAADYLNYRGEHVHVPIDNRINLLKAMGVDVSNPECIETDAYKLDVEPWMHWLGKLNICEAGDQVSFEINLGPQDLDRDFKWIVSDSNGKPIRSGDFRYRDIEETGEYIFEGAKYSRRKVPVGALDPNYYQLLVQSEEKTEETQLAACPPLAYQSSWSDTGQKVWGVIIQLYTLRSERNWGIGDFTDLKILIHHLAAQGAGVLGLNPLHALSPYLHDNFSPYSPSDRRYINPLYIDPCNVVEYIASIENIINRDHLEALRENNKVNYTKVHATKYQIFQEMFCIFIDKELKNISRRYLDFVEYVKQNGSSLLKFAHYEASRQRWPNAKYALCSGKKVEELSKDILSPNKEKTEAQLALLFHCYLQWVSHLQLNECQVEAKESGMKVGLIRDLAVGADGGGSEVSEHRSLFCRDSSVGAPPDPFADTGQNWGIPPAIPSEIRASGYRHFIQLLRENMASCGALRIDHAMSLMRLWWCPPEQTAAYGAYVYYPFHEMLNLLKLESYLSKCLVIGEDLGVVPDEFRDAINRVRIFTNKVFYFEKTPDNLFKRPEDYEAHSLAMVNNHDLPTLVSWWNGSDLKLRVDLNLLEENVNYFDIHRERQQDKQRLMQMLYDSGLYPDNWHGHSLEERADEQLIEAILTLSSRANSKIFVMQLEDLLMMDEPVNVPGTFKEYDNWQRKLSLSVSEIFADERIRSVFEKIDKQRKDA